MEIKVRHNLKGASYLRDLLSEGKAQYACQVASPSTAFRKVCLSQHNERQVLELDMGKIDEMHYIRGLILSTQAIVGHEFTPDCGVDEAWVKKQVTIPKGARLAVDKYRNNFQSKFFKFETDANQPNGTFKVSYDDNQFLILVAEDLSIFIDNPGDKKKHHRDSILTHIRSRCLEILRARYIKDDLEYDKKLDALKRVIETAKVEGGKLSTWDISKDEEWNPEDVATKIHPHAVSNVKKSGE